MTELREILSMLQDQYTCTDREMCDQIAEYCERKLREKRKEKGE